MTMNLGAFAPPETWINCYWHIRYPQLRTGDRLSDTAMQLQHDLDGEQRPYRRAQILEDWAYTITELTRLTRYGWGADDLRLLRLEATILRTAAACQIAAATGNPQPIDGKLPGLDLWVQLQDETDPAERALIYDKLAEVSAAEDDDFAEQILSGLAISEYPLDDPRRGDALAQYDPAEPDHPDHRMLRNIASAAAGLAVAGVATIYGGWLFALAIAGVWSAADYAVAVADRFAPTWELRSVAKWRHGTLVIRGIQFVPAIAYIIAALIRHNHLTSSGCLVIAAVACFVYVATRQAIGPPAITEVGEDTGEPPS